MRMALLTCVVLSLAYCPESQGGWDDFWHEAKVDYYRNKCWPEPFVYADRNAYWTPLATMTANGWIHQNTLSDHHFHRETNSLNRAGEEKVRWILSQTPAQHRTVYVLRAANSEMSSVRLDSVQRAVVKTLPEGDLPEVLFTQSRPRTWSGNWTDSLGKQYQNSMMQPVLPAAAGSQ